MKKFLIVILLTLLATPAVSVRNDSINDFSSTAFTEQDAVLEMPAGKLYGSLILPDNVQPVPLVIIVAGSGPTDRNGNQQGMPTDNLKLLAEGLAGKGFASLRYDKRGIAASRAVVAREEDVILDDFADDLRLWTEKYRSDPRFSQIIIAGHSEGALLGLLAAQENPSVDGLILLAGPGRPLDVILKEQLGAQLLPNRLREAEAALDSLKAGMHVEGTSSSIASLFRPSVQPFLISVFRYDPQELIAALSIPVLIVQGTTDIQIAVTDALMLSEANPAAGLAIIEQMSHILTEYASRNLVLQQMHYQKGGMPLHPELLPALERFIRLLK